MEYYYDIYLNFNEYPIQYYEWEDDDELERVLKIPIIKVDSVKEIIEYHTKIDLEKPKAILTDGINAVAVELINNKVVYLSYLKYEDEANINEIAYNMDDTILNIEYGKKRIIPFELRKISFIKRVVKSLVSNSNEELLKYIYYDVTNKVSNNINKIKEYLITDIDTNFSDKYIDIYEKICK